MKFLPDEFTGLLLWKPVAGQPHLMTIFSTFFYIRKILSHYLPLVQSLIYSQRKLYKPNPEKTWQ